MKQIKVVITLLGEQKLTKIIDSTGENEANEFIPVCGKSILVTEKTGNSLIGKKYAKKCESLSPQQIKDAKALAEKTLKEAEENK